MTIKQFLQKTIENKLSLEQQKKYLLDKPFGTPEELAEVVRFLYSRMPTVPKLPGAIDICGTGGSGLPRINVSTISAFVVAGAGVSVAKHGNNAASGKFGSFDLLNGLGVPGVLSNDELQLRYQQYNLAFLYAKNFHPIMRAFAPIRAELKSPTFFNILGPLLSPVQTQKQIIGTPKLEYAKLIAETAKNLDKERVLVVTGLDGLDEVTLTGPTHVVELKSGKISEYEINPADFGIKEITNLVQVSAMSPGENIKYAEKILACTEKSRRTDLVLINSALALYLAGKSSDLKTCYKFAKDSLSSGAAMKVLENYRRPTILEKITKQKRTFTQSPKTLLGVARKEGTPSPRGAKGEHAMGGSLERQDPSSFGRFYKGGLIAEIKKQSPSEGVINDKIDIVRLAKEYEAAGASAISVLTEPNYFGGSFEDLQKVRSSVNLPILCKDFIVTTEHIDAAKAADADMILLIAAILPKDKMAELYTYAKALNLQVLVEVHNQSELSKALVLKPKIIGINSRNLHDFSLNEKLFDKLKPKIPRNTLVVAESGIKHFCDVPPGADGILVGTELIKHPFPKLKIKELLGKPLLKLCGIRNEKEAKLCDELGVDMIGINFVPRSKRQVDEAVAKKIRQTIKRLVLVGIFEDHEPEQIKKIAKNTGVDAIQASGKYINYDFGLPFIKTIHIDQPRPDKALYVVIDNEVPGSGKSFDHSKLKKFEPSLIAGGIDLVKAKKLLKNAKPLGIDTASGIETDGKVDPKKIKAFAELVANTSYFK